MRIVVVGAGPAGMAAARTAADAGAEVVMVDSEPEAGGQYLRGRARFSHAGVTHLKNTEAWLVEGDTLHLRGPEQLRFDALIIATGAYDRPLPFPGWDGPGVITAGAAQALAKQGVTLAERVIVAGTGPFLLPVATALQDLGATLVGVYEASSPTRWLREARAITANRHKIGELARYRTVLPRLETRTAVIAKHGDRVTVAKLDGQWRPVSHRIVQADLVCVGYGFLPRTDLLPDALRTGDFYDVDEHQRTSVGNVFAAGEVTGIGGADLAEAEGVVAGAAAAGQEPPREAVEAVRRGRLFAGALARAHAVQPGWRTWLDPDTTVCRCEKVRLEDLTDATSMRELKLSSRVAMGRCQGRICARNAADLTGVPFDGQRRVIAVPIPLGELAALPEEKS
ncbi:NAD(P)/FAD-dependent oxidoreductase [Lentzea flaviverrucosa]|uniref:Pyruvate/2-oxoglutarate dehydrogenase complex, dihydrolipoamide dehydrogenase (E3) component n=1 Tax=Lentzea flaviverrucosa TaxID=200379 RepID=A0A1H9XCH9_9PSEU|nr:FAD/NAD(P)-binding oxidoreductase [Lentzea flaviverrucosa]RDI21599.1 pyruvate/2-oxoglutarate dehydrogenase complex dihydrolipoamide dehydrogenase (E3) component [Lentzea flaviverrucosa]SES43835.1 Pyruvate/2-oxoglutarate dehydrogenase complex, dihydrolipoamide dehydrogenase (E3) component [Lentzea flaviverrucosa]